MLTYRSDGRGITVVLLHAFPLSSGLWEKEIKQISRYARVITPDLPGFGFSPRMTTPSIRGMAEEVGRLLDVLEIREPVILGGLSMGGYAAFEFFRLFPSRVQGLMLFSTRAGADSPESREGRFKAIEEIKTSGLESFSEKMARKLLGKHSLEAQPKLTAEVKSMIVNNKPEGVMDALYAMAGRHDSSDLLAGIQCPCLIAAGEEDEVIPPSEALAMHERIPGSEFHRIPKAGHLINVENPEVFETVFMNFLKSNFFEMSQK